MKRLSLLLLSLVTMATFGIGQNLPIRTGEAEADSEWLFEWLLPYGGVSEFQRGISQLQPQLRDPVIVQRLMRIVRRFPLQNRTNSDRNEETETAIALLAYGKTDEAVEVIAPFLKHQQPEIRSFAAENLRITQNPKAVPHLNAALLEIENQLPPILPTDEITQKSLRLLKEYFYALSFIRTENALAVLDASLDRLRKYLGTPLGDDLWKHLKHIRDTGELGDYRRNAAAQSTPASQPAASPAATPVSPPLTTFAATGSPDPTTPVAQAPAGKVEKTGSALWVIGGILTLAVIFTVILKRRA